MDCAWKIVISLKFSSFLLPYFPEFSIFLQPLLTHFLTACLSWVSICYAMGYVVWSLRLLCRFSFGFNEKIKRQEIFIKIKIILGRRRNKYRTCECDFFFHFLFSFFHWFFLFSFSLHGFNFFPPFRYFFHYISLLDWKWTIKNVGISLCDCKFVCFV